MIAFIIIAIITSIMSAISSGIEAMFIALNIYDISRMNIPEKKYKNIEFVVLNKRIFILLFLFLNTIWNVLFSISTFYIFLHLGISNLVAGILSVAFITPFLFLFSEVLPKAIFRKYKEKIILLTYPIFLPFAFIGKIIFKKTSYESMSFEHILEVIQNEFEDSEYSFITEALKNMSEIEEIYIKNIMLPIGKFPVVSINAKIKDIINTSINEEFIIVMDNIYPVGFITIDKLIDELSKNNSDRSISDLIEEPDLAVYENMELSKFLEKNYDFSKPIFVVNDTGTLVGVISKNVIIKTMIKIISDIKKKTKNINQLIVDGNENIFTVFETIGKNISSLEKEYSWIETINTVSGLILTINGQLPKVGQKIKFSDITFQILEINGLRISKVKVIR